MGYPHLPPEILDHVVDLLPNDPESLKQCCLVSKSFVPRTRVCLFANIRFESPKDVEAWKKTFPDPATSPAFYTRSLFVSCVDAVTAANTKEDSSWIRVFSNIVELEVCNRQQDPSDQNDWFAPFHNISPALRSLCVSSRFLSIPQTFDFICSQPLLENLDILAEELVDISDDDMDAFRLSSSPPLTGRLTLSLVEGMDYTVYQLLRLPNGIHFKSIAAAFMTDEGIPELTQLIERCSDTLERIEFRCLLPNPQEPLIDLSKATKLKEVVFLFDKIFPVWITAALKTITPKHKNFRRVIFAIPLFLFRPHDPTDTKAVARQWVELDNLLSKLCDSHRICIGVMCKDEGMGGQMMHEHIEGFLPNASARIKLYADQVESQRRSG